MTHLTQSERDHLWRVYATLLSGIFSTAGGIWTGRGLMHTGWVAPNVLSLVGAVATMICVSFIREERAQYGISKQTPVRDLLFFEGASFGIGFLIAGLVLFAAAFYMDILITALAGAITIFASLSLAAILATRRSFLWLGGILGTLSMFAFFGSLVNMFTRSPLIFSAITFIGLAMGAGFTLFDTQLMLEGVRAGRRTPVVGVVPGSEHASLFPQTDALRLYMNLIRIFTSLLELLMEREERHDGRRRRKA